jgi:hypothetical protein
MNAQLSKRLQSFAWRLGMVLLAAAIDYTATNLGIFELDDTTTVVLGLVLGEVSKFLNNMTK